MMRYIVNEVSKVIHDRGGSTENCNRDDMKGGRDIAVGEFERLMVTGGYDLCRYCFGDDRHGQWVTSPCDADSVTSPTDSATG
jgi:hypothetical protein